MKHFPRLRILLLGTLAILAGAQFLAASLLYRGFLGDHTTALTQHHLVLARALAERCNEALSAMRENLQGIAGLIQEAPDPGALHPLLQAARTFNHAFDGLYYLDTLGILRSCAPPEDETLGFDMSSLPFFPLLRQGKPFVWSDAFLSAATNSLAVTAALPAGNGYLAAQLNLKELSEIARPLALSSGDFAAVVDRFGTVIAHSDQEALWRSENYGQSSTVRRSLDGREAGGMETLQGILGIVGAAPIPQTGWSVVLFRPHSAILAPALTVRNAFFSLLLTEFILLMSAGACFLLVVGRSLRRFTESTHRIAQGSFDEQVAVEYAEFLPLAISFGSMQETLRLRERALRESEIHYRSLVEVAPEGIVLTDENGIIQMANATAATLLGVPTPEGLLGCSGLDFMAAREHHRMEEAAKDLLAHEGEAWHGEGLMHRRNGASFHGEIHLTAMRKTEGIPGGFVLVVRDISERKAAETALRRALADKEALLREVHHRVKNNLQVICSMMDLQARKAQSFDLREAIAESRGRILTMSTAHDMLYRSSSFSAVRMRPYVEHLLGTIRASSPSTVPISTNVDDTELPLDQAIPCGLILNELVVNALHHAFVDQNPGIVSVSVRTAGSFVRMDVSDDGVGIPQNGTVGQGLGFTIVTALATQLDGTFSLRSPRDDGGGSTAEVVFPRLVVPAEVSSS